MSGFTQFSLKTITRCVAFALAIYSTQILAENTIQDVTQDQDKTTNKTKQDKKDSNLATINVTAKRLSQNNGVTGLGEVHKSAAKLTRDQVQNIRDVVQYDPNIGVNEAGGRGSTRGYSMRGVDQARIASSVDGLTDISPLKRVDRHDNTGSRTSASINEVEYENLKEVDIQKGSSSAEYGNGALGGAVRSTTKDIDDFLKPKQKLGGRIKTGYTSKNKGMFVTGAVAGRAGDFDGFVQYTYRKEHETRGYSSLYNGRYFQPLSSSVPGAIEYYNNTYGRWISANEMSGSDFTRLINFDNGDRIIGVARRVPNPQDINRKALLSKFGWHITPENYIGAVIDISENKFITRDMTVPNYWGFINSEEKNGVIFDNGSSKISFGKLNYTPTRYYVDHPKSQRFGLEYQFHNLDKDTFAPDDISVNYNKRHFVLDSAVKKLNCSKWPTVDVNCWPTVDKDHQGQVAQIRHTVYTLDNNQVDTKVSKKLILGSTTHDLKLIAGYSQSKHQIDDDQEELYVQEKGNAESSKDVSGIGPIKQKDFYVGLADTSVLDPKLQTSLALRFDQSKFNFTPDATQLMNRGIALNYTFNNFSWGAGVRYSPFENFSLLYRVSTGFRNPTVFELEGVDFGVSQDTGDKQHTDLRTERSFNNEIGAEYHNRIFKVNGSYFITTYKDLISYVETLYNGRSRYDYINIDKVKVHGFDITARIDGHQFWDKLPDGLEIFARVGETMQMGKNKLDPRVLNGRAYSLDAITPLRIVYGIGYNDLYDKWGINFTTTFSKGKNSKELQSEAKYGGSMTTSNNNSYTSHNWARTDITGHYRIGKYWTIRGGIYNIFNAKYTTWEALRQFSYGMEARLGTPDSRIVTAPGINFLISLEAKF